MRIVLCVSCEDKVACVTDLHSHIQSVHRKKRYNFLKCQHNFKQTSNANFSTAKNYLLLSQLGRNNDKDSSILEGLHEPVYKFFSPKIAEYIARNITGNKFNANFVFKPGVISHDKEVHDLIAFTCELCNIGNLTKCF